MLIDLHYVGWHSRQKACESILHLLTVALGFHGNEEGNPASLLIPVALSGFESVCLFTNHGKAHDTSLIETHAGLQPCMNEHCLSSIAQHQSSMLCKHVFGSVMCSTLPPWKVWFVTTGTTLHC